LQWLSSHSRERGRPPTRRTFWHPGTQRVPYETPGDSGPVIGALRPPARATEPRGRSRGACAGAGSCEYVKSLIRAGGQIRGRPSGPVGVWSDLPGARVRRGTLSRTRSAAPSRATTASKCAPSPAGSSSRRERHGWAQPKWRQTRSTRYAGPWRTEPGVGPQMPPMERPERGLPLWGQEPPPSWATPRFSGFRQSYTD
jgi:hypothetical protein